MLDAISSAPADEFEDLDGKSDLALPGADPRRPVLVRLHGEGGGKKPPPPRTPIEDPNSLRSKATAYILDLIGEGEIEGFVGGAQGIYFDETPLQNADGSYNFNGVFATAQNGTATQEGVPAFPTTKSLPLAPGEFFPGQDWERQITDTDLDAVRLVVQVPALVRQDTTNGDTKGSSVDVRIEIRQSTGSYYVVYHDMISGKCISPYERAYRVDLPKPGPWFVRVSRDEPVPTSGTEQKSTNLSTIIGINNERYSYPHSAIVGMALDAQQFGGAIPRRAYRVKGLKVLVPSNYNPETRTYAGAVWDGTFQYAWTNNPAWVYYDMLTHPRRGLGDLIDASRVDKWALYEIAKYCDGHNARPWNSTEDFSATGKHGVPDGKGGYEPRFTFNGVIATQREAYDVLSNLAASFRAMTYWGTGTVTAVQDSPKDAVQLVAPANVKDGIFNYSSSPLKERHSVANVTWNNPEDFYRTDVETVELPEAIARYGYRETDIALLGCTSRAQAHRAGKWLLDTEFYETEIVSYTCGLDHLRCRPGQIIAIADPNVAGARYGGRITRPQSGAPGAGSRTNFVANSVFLGSTLGAAPPDASTAPNKPGDSVSVVASGVNAQGRRYTDVRFQGHAGGVPGASTTLTTFQPRADVSRFATLDSISDAWTGAISCQEIGEARGLEGVYLNLRAIDRFGTADRMIFGTTNYRDLTEFEAARLTTSGLLSASEAAPRALLLPDMSYGSNPHATGWDGLPTGRPGGWTASAPSGWVYQAVGQGIEDGIPYTDFRLYTPTTGNSNNAGITFASGVTFKAGETWTTAAYVKRLSGDFTGFGNRIFMGGMTGAQATATFPSTGSLKDCLVTKTFTFTGDHVSSSATITLVTPTSGSSGDVVIRVGFPTLTKGALSPQAVYGRDKLIARRVEPEIEFRGPAGADYDFTMRFWDAQIEPGLAASEPIYTYGSPVSEVENSTTLVGLDAPINLEGSDTIAIVRKDGSLMSSGVVYEAGAVRSLTLSPALPEAPEPGAMWVLSGGQTKPRKWRVVGVRESALHEYDVTAVEYDETKYLRVEFDYQLPVPKFSKLAFGPIAAPSNILFIEGLYRSNNAIKTRVTISWEPGRDQNGQYDARVSSFDVDIKGLDGVWNRAATTTGTSFDIPDAEPGTYGFRITARSPLGRSAATVREGCVVLGKSAPPADVEGLIAEGQTGGALLSWDEVLDLDLIGYDVREGLSWDTASVVSARMKGTSLYVPLNDVDLHTFLVRAVDDTGNYSTGIASVQARVAQPGDVASMIATPDNEYVFLSWPSVQGQDIEYEIRGGSSWDFGTLLGRFGGNSARVLWPGAGLSTFWIKAVSRLGLYSEAPVFAQTITNNPAFRNVILTVDHKASDFTSGQAIDATFETAPDSLVTRTNLLNDPLDVNLSSWSKSAGMTVTANTATPPGYSSAIADLIQEGTTNILHRWQQTNGVTKGVTYAIEIVCKPHTSGSKRWLAIGASFVTPTVGTMFDTVTGEVSAPSAGATASADDLGGGWWRFRITFVSNITSFSSVFFGLRNASTGPGTAHTGDGVSGLVVADARFYEVGVPMQSEFFAAHSLPTKLRARNWLDSDFVMVDASTMTWQEAAFAWNSEDAAKASWIAAGEDLGASADRLIALKLDTLPASLIEGFEFNGSLSGIRGGVATVATSASVTYAQHAVRQGFVGSGGTAHVRYTMSPAIPNIFSACVTMRAQGSCATNPEIAILMRDVVGTSGNDMHVLRGTDGSLTLRNTQNLAEDIVIAPEEYQGRTRDSYTICIVQEASLRRITVYAHRAKKLVTKTGAYGPAIAGTWPSFGLNRNSALINYPGNMGIYANLEAHNVAWTAAQAEEKARNGLAPVGYAPFIPLIPGDYDYQDAIVGVRMSAPPAVGRPGLYSCALQIDVQDVNEQAQVECSVAGWNTFTFTKKFSAPPMVAFFQRGGAASVAIGETRNITKTGFEGRLRSSAGADVTGSASYIAVGY